MPRVEYSQDFADSICEHIATGKSLVSWCKPEERPSYTTVMKWLNEHPDFAKNYAHAREAQADYLAEEIQDIADDESGDYRTKDGEETLFLRPENIQRAKLRVDTRKWIASKMKPKKYGDRTILAGDEENPIVTKSDGDIDARLAELLGKAGISGAAGREEPTHSDEQA